jgi:23S rRNA (uracil1939-C5)-methyltransferase
MSPRRIVYVSCDPATLARDVALLKERGYVLKNAMAADLFPRCAHVESVVTLSRKIPDDVIEIDFDLTEMDITTVESKATYPEIKEYVWKHHGLKVSSLYIAQVKRKCGLEVGENYNLPSPGGRPQPQVPPEKEDAIREALKYFAMI